MPLQIQRVPGGIDITRKNPRDVFYESGDEFTDGSVRHILVDGIEQIQERSDGVWNLSAIQDQTIHLGHGIDMSALADAILLHSVEDNKDFLAPEIPFDKVVGSEPARTHNAEPVQARNVIQPFDFADNLSPIQGGVLSIGRAHQAYAYAIYIKVGATPPTEPIDLHVETGENLGQGTVFFRHRYQPELFPANTEVKIQLGSGIGMFPETEFLLAMVSAAPYSLLGHPIGVLWIALDEQDFMYEDLLSFYTGTDKIITDKGDVVTDKGNIVADVVPQGFNFSVTNSLDDQTLLPTLSPPVKTTVIKSLTGEPL